MYAAVVVILYINTKLLHSELFEKDMVNQERRKYYHHHKEGQILNGVFCWDSFWMYIHYAFGTKVTNVWLP